MRRFNTTGTCYPEDHYMVDITKRLDDIVNRVADGEYITINRGRQYGKTTTLYHLAKRLSNDYVVFSISFEKLDSCCFENNKDFANSLLQEFIKQCESENLRRFLDEQKNRNFDEVILNLCQKSEKKVVLLIDNIDKYEGYDCVGDFLSILRADFLSRKKRPTFHSVVLTCVLDIRNYTLRYDKYSLKTPWNIAVPFKADMSLHKDGIAQMLQEYENDNNTGMNVSEMAQMVWDYSSGYPYFVSKLCQLIDQENLGWNKKGMISAVKMVLVEENNTFFDDLNKKLESFPKMAEILKDILYYGKSISYNSDNKILNVAAMFNYIKPVNGKVRIFNRIIETRLYNKFSSDEEISDILYTAGDTDRNQFVEDGKLLMDKILERFAVHFNDIYGGNDIEFKEEEGRRFFMLYIKPIINGTGNYYIEAETRDRSRTDMIIDYLGIQYVIEMKIWRGDAYNTRGEKQLTEYLDFYHINKGYMLSFNFNKSKVSGSKTMQFGDKEIFEVVV